MVTDAPTTAFARAQEAKRTLHAALPSSLHHPHLAIVCGSGLGNLQHSLLPAPAPKVTIQYADIPHFPKSTVEGHEGKMVFGYMRGDGESKVPVVLLVGRAHFYEGHSIDLCTFAMRVCKVLGVQIVFLTNAAGGLNQDYKVGDVVLLQDHLNLAGLVGIHPLRGPNESDFGVRFPPLSDAYELGLRRRAHSAWQAIGGVVGKKTLHEGVYAFVGGPSYETRAECRMLRMLGADVVGMSTVPEVITARHCGMRVMALSLVTNISVLEGGPRGDDAALAGLSEEEMQEHLSRGMANHQEVLEAGKEAAQVMQALIENVVEHVGI